MNVQGVTHIKRRDLAKNEIQILNHKHAQSPMQRYQRNKELQVYLTTHCYNPSSLVEKVVTQLHSLVEWLLFPLGDGQASLGMSGTSTVN